MVMDASSMESLPDYAAGTRLPKWLLPSVTEKKRPKLRPDLLLIPSIPRTETLSPEYMGPPNRNKHTVHILEVGYTADTNHTQKQHDKAQQHEELAQLLTTEGWQVRYTSQEAISLGFAGTIRKDLRPLLTALGASNEAAKKCCNGLHAHAVDNVNDIVVARRQLEREPHHHRTSGS